MQLLPELALLLASSSISDEPTDPLSLLLLLTFALSLDFIKSNLFFRQKQGSSSFG